MSHEVLADFSPKTRGTWGPALITEEAQDAAGRFAAIQKPTVRERAASCHVLWHGEIAARIGTRYEREAQIDRDRGTANLSEWSHGAPSREHQGQECVLFKTRLQVAEYPRIG